MNIRTQFKAELEEGRLWKIKDRIPWLRASPRRICRHSRWPAPVRPAGDAGTAYGAAAWLYWPRSADR